MVAPAANPTAISQGGRKPKPVAKQSKKATAKPQKKLFVVKLQRIPFGFFEKELLGYFRQFGNVLRIRVARSRKTGNHKGWAYVGFDNKSVAEIAAESMNGYLMFEQRLGCKVMKPALIPKSMLKGPLLVMRPSYRGLAKKDALARNRTTGKNDEANAARRAKNMDKTLAKLRNMGLDYDFAVGSKPSKLPVTLAAKDDDVQIIPKPATPKVGQKAATPKAVTPKKAAPATPKQATPKQDTPKVATPKVVTPKAPTPKPTPKAAPVTPKQATPKGKAVPATPATTKKNVVIKTPQTEKVKNVEKTPKFSPKTRAAKAAAAGTPLVKSTLSKTIMKSVAASARPAPIQKTARGGKKKSL